VSRGENGTGSSQEIRGSRQQGFAWGPPKLPESWHRLHGRATVALTERKHSSPAGTHSGPGSEFQPPGLRPGTVEASWTMTDTG